MKYIRTPSVQTMHTILPHRRDYHRDCLAYGWTPTLAGLVAYARERRSGHRALWESEREERACE